METIGKNMRLDQALIAGIDQAIARVGMKKHEGWSLIVERGWKYTDHQSFQEKAPASPDAKDINPYITQDARSTRIRLVHLLRHLPVFSQYVNPHQFATDEPLCQVVDRSSWMLWFSGIHGEHLHASPALQFYTGYSRADFREMGWTRLIQPDERAATVQTCLRAFQKRTPVRFSYHMHHYSGRYGYIIDYAEPRYRPDGSYAGFIGTMWHLDIPPIADSVLVLNGDNTSTKFLSCDSKTVAL